MVLLLQGLVDRLGDQRVDHREDRDAEDHAGEAEKPAEHRDRHQNPEVGNAQPAAQNLRPDDIAVDLLEDKFENHEIQGVDRAFQQDQHTADRYADQRAEERDDVRQAHKDGRDQGEGQPKDQHADVGEDTDDRGVDDLADDEAAETLVGQVGDLQHTVGVLFIEERDNHLLRLRDKALLREQQIDRYHDADDHVENRLGDAVDLVEGHADGLEDVELLGDPVGHGLDRVMLQKPFLERRVLCPPGEGLIGLFIVVLQVVGAEKVLQRGDQPRHNHGDQAVDDCQENQQGADHAQRAAEALQPALGDIGAAQKAPHHPLDKHHDRIHQVGEGHTENDRGDDPDKVRDFAEDKTQVRQNHIEQDARDDDRQQGHAKREVFVSPEQANASFPDYPIISYHNYSESSTEESEKACFSAHICLAIRFEIE